MKRKISEQLSKWKTTANGTSALLVQGARRVGKSYIVEEFAKNAYRSYILIDFNKAGKTVRDIFEHDLDSMDMLFQKLSTLYNTKLYPRESLIIFDEVQLPQLGGDSRSR